MLDRHAGVEQIVGDDSSMAAPPDSLGTHDCSTLASRDLAEFLNALAKSVSHRVVGVVVKALVLPERVLSGRRFAAASAQAAERGEMLVSDSCFGERRAKSIVLVLRIGPRPRNGSDVDHDFDRRAPQ